jgi:RimJ/RimL family protein N-acetyltransferase
MAELAQATIPELPVGLPVDPVEKMTPPARQPLRGQFVSLLPLDADRDAARLYEISHSGITETQLWTYMPYGPFAGAVNMKSWLQQQAQSTDPLFFTVFENNSRQQVGLVSFLAIVPAMRRLELGHIWYGPEVQRTRVNTETIYLMLTEAFDRLNYRRVEWKCDALNSRSRAAAIRLGFKYEGLFRQHIIYKGRNRDTSWYAMLDYEWPTVKSNMARWLYSDEPNLSLHQLNNPTHA